MEVPAVVVDKAMALEGMLIYLGASLYADVAASCLTSAMPPSVESRATW
jgi:hypothetical protein